MKKNPYKFEHWNNSGSVNFHNKYFLKLLVIWWMLLVSVWPNPFGPELLYHFWKRWWNEIANYIHFIWLFPCYLVNFVRPSRENSSFFEWQPHEKVRSTTASWQPHEKVKSTTAARLCKAIKEEILMYYNYKQNLNFCCNINLFYKTDRKKSTTWIWRCILDNKTKNYHVILHGHYWLLHQCENQTGPLTYKRISECIICRISSSHESQ